MNEKNEEKSKKCALVTIIGRPSSGKSTFLNTAAGESISIVSKTPQTTRNAIRGIVNTSLGQLVFVDTPGWHDSEKKMNLKMRQIAEEQLDSSDLILYILDSSRKPADEEKLIAKMLDSHQEKIVAALNKIDLPESNEKKMREFLEKSFPNMSKSRIFAVSAKDDKGIDDVLKSLFSLAKENPPLYPEEYYTDQEVDFRIAEIVRGEAINRLEDELPHCVYVQISDFEMRSPTKAWCRAFLFVETESQKGIVIGKNAQMIKSIRIASIKRLREIFDWKIDLDLQVKVDKNWRQKDRILDKILKTS